MLFYKNIILLVSGVQRYNIFKCRDALRASEIVEKTNIFKVAAICNEKCSIFAADLQQPKNINYGLQNF